MSTTKSFYLSSIFFVFISFHAFSQYREGELSVEKTARGRAEKLRATTLLVIIDDEQSDLGQSIMDAFDRHWKYNEHKFIKREDVAIYEKDKRYSFFTLSTFKYTGISNYEEEGCGFFLKKIDSEHMVYFYPISYSSSIYSKTSSKEDLQLYFPFWLIRMQKRIEMLEKNQTEKLKRDRPGYTSFAKNGKLEVQKKEIYFLKEVLKKMDTPRPDSISGGFMESIAQDTYLPLDSVKSRLALNLSTSEDKIHFIDIEEMNKMMGDKTNNSAAYIYDGAKLYDNEGRLLATVSYLDSRGNAAMKKMTNRIVMIAVPSLLAIVGTFLGIAIIATR